MSAQNLTSTESNLPEWFDPFPEPRTLPYGWDLDNIVPNLNPPAVERADASAENAYS
jgi:hypothetical protein